MTEEIRKQIELIRSRFLELHQEMTTLRERVGLIEDENNRLRSLNKEKELRIGELENNQELLSARIEEYEQMSLHVQTQLPNESDRAIDHLVREIDFCIQQLKSSHE